jgi:hypothetical protein
LRPLTTWERAIVAQLRAAEAARLEQANRAVRVFDPSSLCHAGQFEAVVDDASMQSWVTTRRAGKSVGFVYKAGHVATRIAGCNVLYLSTSIKRGVATIWDLLVGANRDLGWGGVPNHTLHFIRLPNGSKIWVSGCETRTEADSWRGVLPKTALVFVDEGQDWKPDLLSYTYLSVIIPSLSDIGGQFVLAGTPGAPRGFFYDFHKAPGVAFHKWSLFENPHVKEARRLMAEAMRVRGCDETDPSIRREFFAEFAVDLARQIFIYDDKKNGFDRGEWLHDEHRWSGLPAGKWSYVLAGDFGSVDAFAWAAIGWTQHDPRLYFVETDAQTGLGSGAQIEAMKVAADRYGPGLVGVVGDPGGGGASHIITLRQEHWMPIEAAEKAQKAAACITLRDGLRSAKAMVAREEAKFIEELQIPEWDPERVGEVIKGHFPDRVDGGLYGYRKSAGLHHCVERAAEKTPEQLEIERVIAAQVAREQTMRELGIAI